MKVTPYEYSLYKDEPDEMKDSLRLSGVVPVLDCMMPAWTLPAGTNTLFLIGGRGGTKTYSISEKIAYQSAVEKKRCVVLRDEKSLIRDSILNEIKERYETIPFYTGTDWLTTGLKEKDTDKYLVFTKGFKASDKKKKANMKGISDIDIAVVEEAEDIIDAEKFNTFIDSLRKDGVLVIIIMNTPDVGHFLVKQYFDTVEAPIPTHIPAERKKEFEGYFKLIPKEIPGFVCIQTDFTDNPFLSKQVIDRYNGYGDINNSLYNPHYYMTAIKGYSSPGRKGQVLKKVKPISLENYLKLPFKEFIGQDFGTAKPAGTVGVKFDKNNVYARELNYLPMNTIDIGKMYCRFKLTGADRVIADNADEKAWKKLRSGWKRDELHDELFIKEMDKDGKIKERCLFPELLAGFNVWPCVKGPDSINYGIDLMDGLNLFAVSESVNLWEEIRNYCYAQDKYMNYTNDPIDNFNHLIDSWRYVVHDQRGKKKFQIQTQ